MGNKGGASRLEWTGTGMDRNWYEDHIGTLPTGLLSALFSKFPQTAISSEHSVAFLAQKFQSPFTILRTWSSLSQQYSLLLVQFQSELVLALLNTMTKSNLREKEFISLKRPIHSLLLESVMVETHAGQEPGARSWWRGHGGRLLTLVIPGACSACFLIDTSTTSPARAEEYHPEWAGPSHPNP